MYTCRHGRFDVSRLLACRLLRLPANHATSISCFFSFPFSSGKKWRHSQRNAAPGTGHDLPSGPPRKIRLLVDGDQFGSCQVRDVMAQLAGKFVDLKVLIFAAPGVNKSKRLKELLRQSNVVFVEVPRGHNLAAEPNDDAIIHEMQTRARSQYSECTALLTRDKGFAEAISQLMSDEQQFLVLIPSNRVSVMDCYTKKGIPILPLPSEQKSVKVRAILDADGNGRVELGEALDSEAHRAQVQKMYSSWEQLLKAQGCSVTFSSSPGYPIQRISKFWFENGLGTLPVFPVVLAGFALDHAIRQEPQRWISSTKAFAYVLPVSSPPFLGKCALNTYGSRRACSIFRGGGPFMLQDSPKLSVQALRKLGYLDDSWNTDLAEALTCFWNATHNKHQLRKLGFLLDPSETTSDAAAKLRLALLSDNTAGYWQHAGTYTPAVVNILRSKNLLPKTSEPPSSEDMWSAMKSYARVHHLPKMKTFNALAVHIVQHANPANHSPHQRGNIVIE